jgi:S-(hydroxymethyl)glutathione dehydrogenase/alcohol dehydrogenase
MKTRAAIATEPGAPFEIHELDLEGPRAGEVLIELGASGVCHSDVTARDGSLPDLHFPMVLGHEGAGTVREVGAGVTRVAPGDKVIPFMLPECDACPSCIGGRTNECEWIERTSMGSWLLDGTTRFSLGGERIYHAALCSTFSEWTVVPEICVVKIRPDAPLDRVCYVGCGVPTGVGAALHDAAVVPGRSVAVFGLGGVGLNAVQGARIAGAERIIGVDIEPRKGPLGEKFGLTHFVDASSVADPVEAVRELSGGGVDYALESTGSVVAMRQAIDASHFKWGVVVLMGIARPDEHVPIHPYDVISGRVIKGSNFGGAHGRRDLPRYVDWYMEGRLNLDDLITHTMPLEDINRAVDLMHKGESIRSVLVY